ncbi:flagellar hook-associated protein FlgK [Gammaproteobacteria bacterium]|nr:flagellar hook-associated protein FlgK [Gammaproteobacteria bacterium]MDC1426762.1 flagellar hook-associated protein FlgK [Gammaproteobacteria bacterium]
MTDLLTIGATATQLYRQALSTVSNNIANINSDGYSRQEVTTAENAPTQQGVSYLGTGARLVGVQRAYDEFAESGIRTSQSALSAQEPMIKYTDRVINLLGSENGGLSSAIDNFFSSATTLSTNPSEQTYRQEFLSSANFFTARVQSVTSDLSALETEMVGEIKASLDELNQLGASLALVNRQLGKNTKQSLQPSALLDQRDHLMHEMAKLAKLDFEFDIAGRVNVKLAGASDNTKLVEVNNAKSLSAVFPSVPGSPVAIMFDPYGTNVNVGSLKGGSLGGLLSFRDDVFEPLRSDIDSLVLSLATSVNTIHAGGMNQNNETGQDLFNLTTTYKASNVGGTLDAGITAIANDNAVTAVGSFSAQWSAAEATWLVTDIATGTSSGVKPTASNGSVFDYAGITVSLGEAPVSGRQFTIEPSLRVSENISVAISDTTQIASAGRLVVQQSVNNSKLVDVSIDYGYAEPLKLATKTLDAGVRSNFLEKATVTTNTTEPSLRIPKGSDGFSITIQPSLTETQSLQLFTAQRNHLAGTELEAGFATSLASATTLEPNADYISAYTNKTGAAAYLDSELKLGASAEGSLLSFNIPKQTNTSGAPVTLIANGDLTLNGTSLSALTLDNGSTLSAADLAAWTNSISGSSNVKATASNVITIDPANFDSTRRLSINNFTIISDSAPSNAQELAILVNAQSASTNVEGFVDNDGSFVLRNTAGNEGANITLGSDVAETSNFLGRTNSLVTGRVYYEGDAIEFGFKDYWAGNGTAQDLSRLGLATTLSSDATISEDFLVYATGDAKSAELQYRIGDVKTESTTAAEQPLTFTFTASNTVEIRDKTTDTLLAKRTYESAKDIVFGDVRIRLSGAPAVGDSFTLQPNTGGLGDNSNIVALAAVQNIRLEGGELPVQTYITLVNGIGNVNSLSKMSAEALEVVYEDAVALGDAATGVSLDDEAANLIRFQQSYQAAAQIIKVSGDLFDAILSASR